MRIYFLIISVIITLKDAAYSQQWVDRTYAYDSILNINYGTATNFLGGRDTLKLDIYLPKCNISSPNNPKPLLMWIHGGSFLEGSKDDPGIQSLCKKFAQRGYVTASIGYRLGFISDDNSWSCNYPNYPCYFAGDSAEWVRSMYRGIQDCKGALRYLINRHDQFKIDTSNIFVAGESAGAFLALGVALMDTSSEKPKETFATNSLPLPNPNTLDCSYNKGKVFTETQITRPDLGSIEGDIEPSNIKYTIKVIGNIFGGMTSDLLKHYPSGKYKPAIYSFHQPCDIIVPIDSANIYWGISWCFTNGYNCNAIANTNMKIYGARAFSDWNSTFNYGYNMKNEFTSTNFPFSFLFGQASCIDQLNNPCHAYDNPVLRENNLAAYFAAFINTSPICERTTLSIPTQIKRNLRIYPNPANKFINIVSEEGLMNYIARVEIMDIAGKTLLSYVNNNQSTSLSIPLHSLSASGILILNATTRTGERFIIKFLKY